MICLLLTPDQNRPHVFPFFVAAGRLWPLPGTADMSRCSNGRKRSLNAMEIQRRLIREDGTLGEEVKANLVSRSLGLQRLRLSQEEVDLGMGLIEARRALLATIPKLRGVERVHAVIRLQEVIAKAVGALRRRERRDGSPLWTKPRRSSSVLWRGPARGGRAKQDDEDVQDREPEAGDVPAEADDESADGGAGGEA
jgi:hypothetical protein